MKHSLVILFFTLASAVMGAEKPNLLLIYTDDQGYGDASCLNAESKFQTPNLDRLAREGLTLTDGHCSDTVCTPSRYGLLTGRYSWRTTLKRGVMGAEGKCLIADGRVTLASLLRDHGYQTGMVGKWHLGMDFPGEKGSRDWSQPVRDMPLDKGFDYYWGVPASMNYGVLAWFEGRHAKVPPTQFTRKKPNGIAISDYRIMPPYEAKPKAKGDLEVAPDFVDSECLTRFTDRAISWIQSKASDARAGKPFFLYLPYTSPHKPVIPLEKFRGQGKAGAYGEFMAETDWHVGRLLDLLDEEKLAENTMIVFTSDNGPETTWAERAKRFQHQSNGIYREGKRSIYEGGHRVPFLIRWPARIKPGGKLETPVCQTDLLATVGEMLDADLPSNAGEDSHSFFKAMLDPSKTTANRPPLIHHSSGGRFAIRDGRWKLVMEGKKKSEKRELYDLDSDPGEALNVIAQHPDVAKKLVSKITSIVKNGRSTPGDPVPNDTPPWSDLIWMPSVE
jgi:arylsulfatase A